MERITISHRPALTALHHVLLELDGHGGYSVRELKHGATPHLFRTKLASGSAAAATATTTTTTTTSSSLSGGNSEDNTASPVMPTATAATATATTAAAAAAAAAALGDNAESVGSSSDASGQRQHSALPSPLRALPRVSRVRRLLRLLRVLVPSMAGKAGRTLVALGAVVIFRVALSDRIARLNGETVRLLLLDDLPGFRRLVGISLLQCVASSVLAPTLLYLTRTLSLDWRKKLQQMLSALCV